MKRVLLSVVLIGCITSLALAEDGLADRLKKMQMNMNEDHYLLFEDNSLIICDRQTDEYMIEITPEYELFIRSKKININNNQKELLGEYYKAQKELFDNRNELGAKGIRIGLASVKLAAHAVGGAIELVFSGFDEDKEKELEENIEREADKLEKHADGLESHADRIEELVKEINRLNYKLHDHIPELRKYDLYMDADEF